MRRFETQVWVEIDPDEAVEYVQMTFTPEEVFPEKELIQWAEENGFTKGGSDD